MALDPAQDPAIYALSGVTAVESAGTWYFLRDCQPVKRVQTASPYDFRPDGPAFGSPLGGLSYPIDNVCHTPSNGLKRARSYLQRVCPTPSMYVVPVNYQPTDPYAASPEGRWHQNWRADRDPNPELPYVVNQTATSYCDHAGYHIGSTGPSWGTKSVPVHARVTRVETRQHLSRHVTHSRMR